MMKYLAGILSIIGIFLLTSTGYAHMHDRPDLDAWFSQLRSSKGMCCSFVDGSALRDVDWDIANEGRACMVLPTDEQSNEPSHYCVRLEGQWWAVPDKAVIEDPNRYGPAVVWPIYVSSMGAKNKLIGIRCFMPGAGA